MTNKIIPSVVNRYGKVYYPEGWEWILAFALKGCNWAIKIASTEDFRKTVRDSIKARHKKYAEELIAQYEEKITKLKEQFGI